MLAGSLQLFMAEALIVPTGMVTLAFLTRQLGKGGYGMFTLAVTVVTWIEWTLVTVTARAINKSVSETSDWAPVATTALRLHLILGLVAMVVVMASAGPVAGLLGDPSLALYFRLLALDIPLFLLAQGHRNILIGIGRYRARAWLSAGRWLTRLALLIICVSVGGGVTGAIVALVGTSLVELILARCFIRPPMRGASSFPTGKLLAMAWPLFLLGTSLRLFEKVDVFLLKYLGTSNDEIGLYGAAQNLTILSGIFSLAFTPLLLSTLMRLRRDGEHDRARAMARDAMRLGILLLPFAALMAGAANEIVGLVAGGAFRAAGPLLQALIIGSIGMVLISVGTVVLVANERSWSAAVVGGVTLVLTVSAQWWAIPRWGTQGAATCTAAFQWVGAVLVAAMMGREGNLLPGVKSMANSFASSGLVYLAATHWNTRGPLVLVKLAVLAGGVVAAYVVVGELDQRERNLVRSLVTWTSPT